MLKIIAKMLQRPWLRFSTNNNAKCSVAIFEYDKELQCGKYDQVAIEASSGECWVFNDCVIAPLLSPNLLMLMVTPEFGIVKTLSRHCQTTQHMF